MARTNTANARLPTIAMGDVVRFFYPSCGCWILGTVDQLLPAPSPMARITASATTRTFPFTVAGEVFYVDLASTPIVRLSPQEAETLPPTIHTEAFPISTTIRLNYYGMDLFGTVLEHLPPTSATPAPFLRVRVHPHPLRKWKLADIVSIRADLAKVHRVTGSRK